MLSGGRYHSKIPTIMHTLEVLILGNLDYQETSAVDVGGHSFHQLRDDTFKVLYWKPCTARIQTSIDVIIFGVGFSGWRLVPQIHVEWEVLRCAVGRFLFLHVHQFV